MLNSLKSVFNLLFESVRGSRYVTPTEAHPSLGPVLYALKTHNDPAPAHALFHALQGADRDLRVPLVQAVGERYFNALPWEAQAHVAERCAQGLDPFWMMACAWWHVDRAWAARGGGSAQTVTPEGWAVLRERCTLARRDLARAAAIDPHDPTPHALMMRVARGLGAREVAEEHYAAALRCSATSVETHEAYLVCVSERWFGTHDEMVTKARTIARAMPDGSDAAGLIISAHHDVFDHTIAFDDDQPAAVAYARRPEVLREVIEACARSIDHPTHVPTLQTPRLRHLAALLFYHADERERAALQLARVGNVFVKNPWWRVNVTPETFYTSVRRELGLAV